MAHSIFLMNSCIGTCVACWGHSRMIWFSSYFLNSLRHIWAPIGWVGRIWWEIFIKVNSLRKKSHPFVVEIWMIDWNLNFVRIKDLFKIKNKKNLYFGKFFWVVMVGCHQHNILIHMQFNHGYTWHWELRQYFLILLYYLTSKFFHDRQKFILCCETPDYFCGKIRIIFIHTSYTRIQIYLTFTKLIE